MIFEIPTQRLTGCNFITIHRRNVVTCLKPRTCQCATDCYRLDLRLTFIRIITESQHITFFRCRMIGQSFFFPISFYSNCDIFIFQPFQCQIRIQLSSQINLLPIKGSDQIAFFQPCSFFRRPFFYLCDNRRIVSDNTYNNHCTEKCKNKIKNRSCGNDGKTSPDRFAVKCPFSVIFSIFSPHHTGTAKRNQFQ